MSKKKRTPAELEQELEKLHKKQKEIEDELRLSIVEEWYCNPYDEFAFVVSSKDGQVGYVRIQNVRQSHHILLREIDCGKYQKVDIQEVWAGYIVGELTSFLKNFQLSSRLSVLTILGPVEGLVEIIQQAKEETFHYYCLYQDQWYINDELDIHVMQKIDGVQ